MQPFYISGSNIFTIRTSPTGSGVLKLNLQNMYTLVNTTASISSYKYNAYESLLSFTASVKTLVSSSIGDEYRATIVDSVSGSIWNGSIQVYQSQSINKPVYTNQIPLEGVYISNVTDNEYIILD
jgi:hypothetical protein